MFNPSFIDAEFMERWLGGNKIDSMSSKTLFDIQTLITHYRDILVSDKNVKVEFPTEANEGAKASVDESIVYIPTNLLAEGRVDDTIACMIHELHHIKLSDSERQIWASCFSMICKCMDSLFVPTGDDGDEEWTSLYDIIMGDNKLTFSKLYDEKMEVTGSVLFLRKVCNDLAFLLNAVEDVRIDSMTPPNLAKYGNKMDKRIFEESFSPKYEGGEMDEETLHNVAFRLLFHHKGFIEDDYIKDKFGDTEKIIGSTPAENNKETFSVFKEVIRKHIEWSFKNLEETLSTAMGGVDFMDMYMSEKSKKDTESDLMKEMEGGNETIGARASSDTKGIDFEDREITDGEVPVSIGEVLAKNDNEVKSKDRLKPTLIPATMIADIESFKNIKIHHTKENFDSSAYAVDYSTVVFDATI